MERSLFQQLLKNLREMKQVVVAFSGGVDSSLLAYSARRVLGSRMVALTINTPYIPGWEIEEATEFAATHDIPHEVIELQIPANISKNPPDRCYLCKKELFQVIERRAGELGITTIIEGSNQDDLSDYRPGMRALKELRILSPMLELGLTKEDIRTISRREGLSTWDKPAYACLLSRIPYHTRITDSELKRIAEAEKVLRELALPGSRVRSHGDIARVEVALSHFEDVLKSEMRVQLVEKIKRCGYTYVALDLEGYQTGSLNRTLTSDGHHE